MPKPVSGPERLRTPWIQILNSDNGLIQTDRSASVKFQQRWVTSILTRWAPIVPGYDPTTILT